MQSFDWNSWDPFTDKVQKLIDKLGSPLSLNVQQVCVFVKVEHNHGIQKNHIVVFYFEIVIILCEYF